MDFLSDVLLKFWKEVIVAVMLTATLPFIRKYVRKQRAKILGFLREKERLKQSLLEEEKKRKEAESKYQAEADEKRKVQEEANSLRAALEQERKARQEAERKCQASQEVSTSKVSKLMRTFSMFSRPKEAEVNPNAQNEELERLKLALENAERMRQNEAEEKLRAQAETERLRGLLNQAEKKLKAIEDAKPAPNSMTAKLMELLKACEALPYTNHSEVGSMQAINYDNVRYLFPPEGDVLRMKVFNAVVHYFQKNYVYYRKLGVHKCMVLYVLVIIAEGISSKQISINEHKKLIWNTASQFIDKIRKEHFDEQPELDEPDDYDTRSAKTEAGEAFGQFPSEIILADKEFLNALLATAKR